uniref:Uncharacterized protein n=1 Tax=Rhizophora mucronata TaxID=61149 RepID=A0A2P2R0B7_RHIMU
MTIKWKDQPHAPITSTKMQGHHGRSFKKERG